MCDTRGWFEEFENLGFSAISFLEALSVWSKELQSWRIQFAKNGSKCAADLEAKNVPNGRDMDLEKERNKVKIQYKLF